MAIVERAEIEMAEEKQDIYISESYMIPVDISDCIATVYTCWV
jgi:hypothetical protein